MKEKEVIEQIKQLRQDLTGLAWCVHMLNPSREVSLAYTQLQEAKSWCGKVLQEFKQDNPYPDSAKPESRNIEPQADVPEENPFLDQFNQLEEKTQTGYVKLLRKLVGDAVERMKALHIEIDFLIYSLSLEEDNPIAESLWIGPYTSWAIKAAELARIWLGWELDRIRQEIELQGKEYNSALRPALPLQ